VNNGAPPKALLQAFEPALARLHAEAASRFGTPRVCLLPVGYERRPFSFVLRVAIVRGDAGEPSGHAFLKIFKPKDPAHGVDLKARVAGDFATTRAIHEFLSRWDDVGAVRPIACYDDLLVVVTAEAAGETLLQRLSARAAWFPSARTMADLTATMAGVGRWLARFHGFEARDEQISVPKLLDYVDVRLRRLASEEVITASYRAHILRYLSSLAATVAPCDLREVAIHADMAPGNILVDGTRIVVLDFAMAGRGSYLHDVSRLYLQLDVFRAKPQFRGRVVEALQAALLRGLDPALTPDHPLFRCLLMLHRVNHLGTLSLYREHFPASVLSARVRRLHRAWIDRELARPGVVA
jgi:hypothetical protein